MANNYFGLILLVLITAPVYNLLPKYLKIYFLLTLSLIIYALFNISFLLILFLVIFVTFIFSFLIRKNKLGEYSIHLGCITVLSPLIFYKYLLIWFDSSFFSFLPISSLTFGGMGQVLIPVGLSFYTFQCIGYLVDIKRNIVTPEKNIFKLAAFISFFPQILAGPIERFKDLSHQLFYANRPNPSMILDGITITLYGIFLKIAVAERLAPYVDTIFINYENLSQFSIFFGMLAFTIQMFADFGGYSFMALGVAKLYGISLTNNFKQPFLSVNIIDFWQRWHISLTRWVGDYIYKPLGILLLKKYKKQRVIIQYTTMMITWITIGMWHGASINFLLFGLLQFIFITLTYQIIKRNKIINIYIKSFFGFLITLIFVIITFALIRAPDISTYIGMINGLFYGAGELILPSGKIELLCGVTILIFIEILIFEKSPLRNILINSMYSVLARTFGIVFLFLSILFLGYDETSAFIYFRY